MLDKERRTKKYMQDQRHKKRLERLAKSESRSYPSGAYMVDERRDENGNWVPREKPYAVRTNKSKNATRYRYFKNYSNRIIRRNKLEDVADGGTYRKIFDYWWTVD
jgi:hypothetical protein